MAATPDLSNLSTAFVELGGQVFGKKVVEWDLAKYGIELRTNVSTPQPLSKMAAQGQPMPYQSDDDTSGNGVEVADRILTAYDSKWDYDFDPKKFRNTYLANAAKANGNFVQMATEQVVKEYLSKLYMSTLYSGSRNGSGTTAAAICDGLGTIIAAEITATTITPVAVNAMTGSNAVTEVEKVTDAATPYMKENGFNVLCSWGTLEKYRTHYRTLNGFAFNPDANGQYKIDGKNARLIACAWMGTSSRVIATVDNNIVVGTEKDGVEFAASMRRNIIECRPMMALGVQIADLEHFVVNDKA